ncbi:MAG: ABC transporter permease [Euryarchaeota archaeon]|jgi:putative spermidine/putrescine transport system permease protein|nr:ABC transporter permease [Euryarchaeota archaeon]MDP7542368.1 ABC transporter permease [Acidimicrobiales bacterium]|tara:strand:- start:2154 stop:3419 length:1266 start_codon:yes stop_codon:yes gene_type:complete
MATGHKSSSADIDLRALRRSMRRSQRRDNARSLLLIAPLLVFVLVTFAIPIFQMLTRSVDNSVVPETLPLTVEVIGSWEPADSADLPPEEVYRAFVADIQVAADARRHTVLGSRLNYEMPGIASKFRQLGRAVDDWDLEADGPFKDLLISENEAWADPVVWRTIRNYSGNYTTGYFANAVDYQLTEDGFEKRPEAESIYVMLFMRTIKMSLIITFTCFALGYPVAWLLANSSDRYANLMLILVLLPFWTSLLVRTSAWKVLLQNKGIINESLLSIGVINEPLPLMYNQFATIVAMTHILLPFMILPLYSVMKTIPPVHVRAAKSLGANGFTAFRRVYFPESTPGIGAGAILVFILAVGYYITPEIVGGRTGIFISNRIAYNISSSLNWGLAAALGTILLVAVLILYWIYDRIVGIDNMKLG